MTIEKPIVRHAPRETPAAHFCFMPLAIFRASEKIGA